MSVCGEPFCATHMYGDSQCPLSELVFQVRKGENGYYVVDTSANNLVASHPFQFEDEAIDYSAYLNRSDNDALVQRFLDTEGVMYCPESQ